MVGKFLPPPDNSFGISNSGQFISAVNSHLALKEINPDGTISTVKNTSLQTFSQFIAFQDSKFDPRVIYDPEADRFFIVYLAGFSSESTSILVAASATDDIGGDWNIYSIAGSPIADQWSD